MKNIFPQEIINLSVESHFDKFSKTSQRIYIATILFLVGVTFSIFFIKTNISVQSSGLIRSMSEPIEITSPIIAEVLKTAIVENGFVNKGDTLVWLNKDKFSERIRHIENLMLQNSDYQRDLKLLETSNYDSLKTELYKSVYGQYKQKVEEYDLEIELLAKSFNRIESLFKKNVVPLTEKEEKEYQLKSAFEKKSAYLRQCKSEWQQAAIDYRLTNEKYNNEINELLKDFKNYAIQSPCDGFVTNFNGIQSGSFVTTGQTIAIISPEDKLISEHLVPPKDIGYLTKTMPVSFQVDAYNYNQWGLVSGEIMDISNEIYLVNNRPYFKVKCTMNEDYLSLKNGFKGYLKKGLTTTARFQVTERTLAQQLFDKADDWLNPKLSN